MRIEIRERVWDCKQCGQKRILGRYGNCPHCGNPRGEGTRFYHYEDNPRPLTKTEIEELGVTDGPDWQCAFCGQLNRSDRNTCKGCGAEKTDTTYFDMVRNETKTGYDEHPVPDAPRQNPIGDRKRTILTILGIFATVLVLFWAISAYRSDRNLPAVVTELSWETTIDIEHYTTNQHEGWTMPTGARLVRTEERVTGYRDGQLLYYDEHTVSVPKQVKVGTEEQLVDVIDMGNGFEQAVYDTVDIYDTVYETEVVRTPVYEQIPIYQTWYVYDQDEWEHARYVTETGTKPEKPYYGEVILAQNERERNRNTSYHAVYDVTKNDETTSVPGILSKKDYERLSVGNDVTVNVMFGAAEYNGPAAPAQRTGR